MDWSKNSVNNYKIDKKARFQNSRYYFKKGVGVPMVSSTQITASMIDERLFDQSIVGIFPKSNQIKYLNYLLAFFNSPTCNLLIRTINPTANNPANYLKKIPLILPTKDQLKRINLLIKDIIDEIKTTDKYSVEKENEINNLIANIYEI